MPLILALQIPPALPIITSMGKKLQLAVLCGGQSTEHEISVRSAKNIIAALNPDKYAVTVVYITHAGQWYLVKNPSLFIDNDPAVLVQTQQLDPITVVLGDSHQPWQSLDNPQQRYAVDCVFPMLHGTFGEDGVLQGLLDLLNLPYVGAGTQSSALCMQKDVTKHLLRAADIPTTDWVTLYSQDALSVNYQELVDKFGKNLFIKPASLGSSVGIMPVDNQIKFDAAVKDAFRYDERVLVEPRIYGREIECAVLGNGKPQASLPGEIITQHDDYYSYDAKYRDPQSAETQVPAKLAPDVAATIREMAVKVFKVMNCSGMARVDFFVVNDTDVLVNEINTIPGFTNISMYPTMWEANGLSYRDLLDKLIDLALERYRDQQSLIRIYRQ